MQIFLSLGLLGKFLADPQEPRNLFSRNTFFSIMVAFIFLIFSNIFQIFLKMLLENKALFQINKYYLYK